MTIKKIPQIFMQLVYATLFKKRTEKKKSAQMGRKVMK